MMMMSKPLIPGRTVRALTQSIPASALFAKYRRHPRREGQAAEGPRLFTACSRAHGLTLSLEAAAMRKCRRRTRRTHGEPKFSAGVISGRSECWSTSKASSGASCVSAAVCARRQRPGPERAPCSGASSRTNWAGSCTAPTRRPGAAFRARLGYPLHTLYKTQRLSYTSREQPSVLDDRTATAQRERERQRHTRGNPGAAKPRGYREFDMRSDAMPVGLPILRTAFACGGVLCLIRFRFPSGF
jgi:hypothetical protein